MSETQKPVAAAYIIPAELLFGIRAYLEQRPYHEVAAGVTALANLKPVDPACACSALTSDA